MQLGFQMNRHGWTRGKKLRSAGPIDNALTASRQAHRDAEIDCFRLSGKQIGCWIGAALGWVARVWSKTLRSTEDRDPCLPALQGLLPRDVHSFSNLGLGCHGHGDPIGEQACLGAWRRPQTAGCQGTWSGRWTLSFTPPSLRGHLPPDLDSLRRLLLAFVCHGYRCRLIWNASQARGTVPFAAWESILHRNT
jgi:hypothetical protein